MTNSTQEDAMRRVETALTEWRKASEEALEGAGIIWESGDRIASWLATWETLKASETSAAKRLAYAVSEAWPKWPTREAKRHAVATNEGI